MHFLQKMSALVQSEVENIMKSAVLYLKRAGWP